MIHSNNEAQFDQTILQITPLLKEFSDYDLVIGIPFSADSNNLATLLESVDKVLQSWIGRRQLIVCVGSYSASNILNSIQELSLQHPHIQFLLPQDISGRGMSIRAIIEISKRLDADLLLFNANMATGKGPGIDNTWLESLLTPIQGHYDMVLGSLRRYLGLDSIAHMLGAPILEVFYGARVGDPLGGIYAISHDFIEELAHEARFWGDTIKGSGIDFWLLTRALCWNKNVCEVNMGGVVSPHPLETRNQIFCDHARTVFEAIKRDCAIWLQDRLVIRVADILVRSEVKRPDVISYSVPQLAGNCRTMLDKNRQFIEKLENRERIRNLRLLSDEEFHLSDELWVEALFELLLLYAFGEEEQKESVFSILTALYNGRVASFILEMQSFNHQIRSIPEEEKDELRVDRMESIRQRLTNHFWIKKPDLNRKWLSTREQVKPPIIPLGYMEYIPGKPIVIPKKITGKDRHLVQTDNIFRELRKRYETRFNNFITEGLGIDAKASPSIIVTAVENFIGQLEETLSQLLPGDLSTPQGVNHYVTELLNLFPPQRMFTISSDLLREMLVRFPPVNLMIPLGFYKPADLIKNMDPRDAVTYANLIESWSYTDRDLIWLIDNLKPESLGWVDIKPIILTKEMQMGRVLAQAKVTNLNRVTARLLVKVLENQKGGKYPRLHYFTNIVRRLAVAQHYSQLFKITARERKNIGLKLKNALLGLRKGDDFSAYNIFENLHHRSLVEMINQVANLLYEQGKQEHARLFKLMADGYGLSQVLENGVFLTCTAWSWASYSFKGGLNIPTPFTTSVEGRWFNHDFLELLYQELGYDSQEIMQIVLRLIQEGKSGNNLLDTLLPARPKDVAVVVQETTNEPSKYLKRYKGNPMLEPLEGSTWESKFVLNPGALRIEDKVYLFYRAVGEDNISHIGLAITDGYQVLERLPYPILSPAIPEEKMGCEDARTMIIGDKIYMAYTAYDGNIAQIAVASIPVDEFKAGNYIGWKREGLAFTNIWDKDAIILPEKINGRYVIYHRIEPSIWVTYTSELKFPIKERHAIILGPRPGRMWDSLKIGAGAQALKTKYGWLLIYHGVDYNYVYRLGVLLVDLNNPHKVLYRSPNPVLEPEEDYEIGMSGAWVPNVVFTCGAVPAVDKEVLEDDDEILVYYGAADTSIGMAKATLKDLIPDAFRKVQNSGL